MGKDAQTALEPAPPSLVPQSRLTMATIVSPRPDGSMAWAACPVGSASEWSRTVSNTVCSKASKVTLNAVCACTSAFVASSLATSRTGSDEIQQPVLDEAAGDEVADPGGTDGRTFEGGMVRPGDPVACHVNPNVLRRWIRRRPKRGLGWVQKRLYVRMPQPGMKGEHAGGVPLRLGRDRPGAPRSRSGLSRQQAAGAVLSLSHC
jgi:hypothetical protein